MPTPTTMQRPAARVWLARCGWLLLIWTLSVAALGGVAALLHGLMRAAGMR